MIVDFNISANFNIIFSRTYPTDVTTSNSGHDKNDGLQLLILGWGHSHSILFLVWGRMREFIVMNNQAMTLPAQRRYQPSVCYMLW